MNEALTPVKKCCKFATFHVKKHRIRKLWHFWRKHWKVSKMCQRTFLVTKVITVLDLVKCNQFFNHLFWGPDGASRQRKVREGPNYTEACQLLIWFMTGLIYGTLVGTEATTFGLPDQRANTWQFGVRRISVTISRWQAKGRTLRSDLSENWNLWVK